MLKDIAVHSDRPGSGSAVVTALQSLTTAIFLLLAGSVLLLLLFLLLAPLLALSRGALSLRLFARALGVDLLQQYRRVLVGLGRVPVLGVADDVHARFAFLQQLL